MILYYDSRIRDVVVKRWAESRVPGLETGAEVNILENEIDSYDSFTLKDPKIPISFKNEIARKLYDAESEVIKANVRMHREAWNENGKTVRTDDEDLRQDLVREYKRYVCGLSVHGL